MPSEEMEANRCSMMTADKLPLLPNYHLQIQSQMEEGHPTHYMVEVKEVSLRVAQDFKTLKTIRFGG